MSADIPEQTGVRITFRSNNGGQTWESINNRTDWPPASPRAGMTVFAPSGAILFSSPANSMFKNNFTVHLSMNMGNEWQFKRIVDNGFCANSDIEVTANNKICVVYESGAGTYGNIKYAVFDLEWLMR